MTIFLCEFTSENINRSIGEDHGWSPFALRACLDIHNRQIASSIVRLQRELQFPAFGSDIVNEALVMQIAVDLARHFASFPDHSRAATGLTARHLRMLKERLHAGGHPPSLADLAEISSLSIKQLTRGFRVSEGRSIGEYIAKHRLERAKDLLSRDRSIKQIAYECGFSSPNHFAVSFRVETGMTPSEFRHLARRSPRSTGSPHRPSQIGRARHTYRDSGASSPCANGTC